MLADDYIDMAHEHDKRAAHLEMLHQRKVDRTHRHYEVRLKAVLLVLVAVVCLLAVHTFYEIRQYEVVSHDKDKPINPQLSR